MDFISLTTWDQQLPGAGEFKAFTSEIHSSPQLRSVTRAKGGKQPASTAGNLRICLYWKIILSSLSLVNFKPSSLSSTSSNHLRDSLKLFVYPKLALALWHLKVLCHCKFAGLLKLRSAIPKAFLTLLTGKNGAILPAATPLYIQSKITELWHSDADETFLKSIFNQGLNFRDSIWISNLRKKTWTPHRDRYLYNTRRHVCSFSIVFLINVRRHIHRELPIAHTQILVTTHLAACLSHPCLLVCRFALFKCHCDKSYTCPIDGYYPSKTDRMHSQKKMETSRTWKKTPCSTKAAICTSCSFNSGVFGRNLMVVPKNEEFFAARWDAGHAPVLRVDSYRHWEKEWEKHRVGSPSQLGPLDTIDIVPRCLTTTEHTEPLHLPKRRREHRFGPAQSSRNLELPGMEHPAWLCGSEPRGAFKILQVIHFVPQKE